MGSALPSQELNPPLLLTLPATLSTPLQHRHPAAASRCIVEVLFRTGARNQVTLLFLKASGWRAAWWKPAVRPQRRRPHLPSLLAPLPAVPAADTSTVPPLHTSLPATGWVVAGFALEAFTVPIVSGTPVQQLFNIRVRGVGTAALHLALTCTATSTAGQQGPGTPRCRTLCSGSSHPAAPAAAAPASACLHPSAYHP